MLAAVPLAGRVVTGDALYCQRSLCTQIVAAGGAYVLAGKANQPTLLTRVQDVFDHALLWGDVLEAHATHETRHGRIERRRLTVAPAASLTDVNPWPGLAQIYRIERVVVRKTTGARRTEVVHGITSLPADQADAAGLLALVRGHWGIENRLHYVRDVTFGEDASRVQRGATPQILAALRNAVLTLLRHHNPRSNTPATLRAIAWQRSALTCLGLTPP